MTLQTTIAGIAVPAKIGSMTTEEKVDNTAVATFTVVGNYNISQDMYVVITDTFTGLDLYSGFIDSVDDQYLEGNAAHTWVITCKDMRWLLEKRYWIGPEFQGWMAGDVAAELCRTMLASEGVTAAYALRHDMDASSFGAGTLVNATAANGTLTLADAGTDFTKTETTTADFNAGTLTLVGGVNNSLQLTSYVALKYSATAGANLDNNNLYTYTKVWAGTAYTLVAGDEIYCDVWVDSRSPEIKASIDILFSDGTWMHDFSTDFQDQEVIPMYAATDLKGWADDQWYSRKCIVSAARAGKVVTAVYLSFQGEKGGDYTAYFKNIKITATGGVTLRRSIFSGTDTKPSSNVRASSNGYYNINASVTTTYAETGNRVSPSNSIAAVGIVKGSVVSWNEIDTIQLAGASQNVAQQVMVEASYDDGATYLPCTNHGALPGLIVGMNTSGRSILLRETLAIGGTDPTKAPQLSDCSFTVFTAAAMTKTDFVDIDNTSVLMGGGTLTNCTSYTDGVKTTGQYRNWDDLSVASQTLFGATGTGAPEMACAENYMFLRNDSGLDEKSRFDFAGTWQNFILEIDIHLVDAANCNYGVVYRETFWATTNDTYAYNAFITPTNITLGRGSNATVGSFTTIATTAVTLTSGAWYRMKIVVNGTSHQIFLNDVLFISATDATFSAAGNVGVRLWNNSGTRHSAHFDNFGIIGYEADLISVSSRVTAATSLSGIVGSSIVNWLAIVPSTSTLLVESSIDGGTVWNTCTNGAQIPLLVPGFNAAGKSLKFRFTMTNQAINLPIQIIGFSSFVIGQYNATGTRVSPSLVLDPVGTQIGSTSVSWSDTVVPNTTIGYDWSTDNIGFTALSSSGSPVTGLASNGAMIADSFSVNTVANYTATFWTGGVLPVFTVDTANSRMRVTSGSSGIILWNTFPAASDVYLEAVVSQSEAGGLVWRYVDTGNLYYLTLADNSASSGPNTLAIRYRQFTGDTQILSPTTLPVTFTRGTYHTIKLTMIGSQITVWWDGIVVTTIADTHLTAAGQVGFRQNSGVETDWYAIRTQALGTTAVGKLLYTRVRLGTTDPTVKPYTRSLVASARGPDLMTGNLIPDTKYAYQSTLAAIMDDVSKQSQLSWKVQTTSKKLKMLSRNYNTADWPLYSADPQFRGTDLIPKLTKASPLYRNRQFVYNCIDLQTITGEQKKGDGNTQSWDVTYPVDSIQTITLDGATQTFGIQGIVTGVSFYYTKGSTSISIDTSQPILTSAQLLSITYTGQVPYTAMKESTSQQTALASIDSSSGIVEASEDGKGILRAAADSLAQARIDQYAILSRTFVYNTLRTGLHAGQFQPVFVSEHGIWNSYFLITDIVTTPKLGANGTVWYIYTVTCTDGPSIGTWESLFAQALLGA